MPTPTLGTVLSVGTVELSISMASVQQHRLIKERLRCQHVQLKVVETTMGRKEQRERERKEAAKGSYALSGFDFLPKKRSWSDGDLHFTFTSYIYFNRIAEKQIHTYRACVPDSS